MTLEHKLQIVFFVAVAFWCCYVIAKMIIEASPEKEILKEMFKQRKPVEPAKKKYPFAVYHSDGTISIPDAEMQEALKEYKEAEKMLRETTSPDRYDEAFYRVAAARSRLDAIRSERISQRQAVGG